MKTTMSSTNPNAANSETKGGESSADSQDSNKSKTVNSEDNLNQTSKEADEDCEDCWFRRFFKRGECKDAFIEVDNCDKDADDDMKCREAILKLDTCMYANVHYYGQYLAAKKEMLTQALKDLEMAEEAAAAAAKKKEEEEETSKGK